MPNGHLMGAIGVAILSKNEIEKEYDFSNIDKFKFETSSINCNKCPNNCEIILVKRNNKIIDGWGNRCEKGEIKVRN